MHYEYAHRLPSEPRPAFQAQRRGTHCEVGTPSPLSIVYSGCLVLPCAAHGGRKQVKRDERDYYQYYLEHPRPPFLKLEWFVFCLDPSLAEVAV